MQEKSRPPVPGWIPRPARPRTARHATPGGRGGSGMSMIGIVPAAGAGTRMQPLGCSKELLPVPADTQGGPDVLMAVAECLLERMWAGGADRACVVISPQKPDLLAYLGRRQPQAMFVVQPEPIGLCDAIFRAVPWIAGDEPVLIGLPDTLWYPSDAFRQVSSDAIHLISFPSEHPQDFDAIVAGEGNRVARVEVKRGGATSRRIWGAIRAPGDALRELHRLWLQRDRADVYLGSLLNAWIEQGHPVTFDRTGSEYIDLGTPSGFAAAWRRSAARKADRSA